MNPRKRFGLGDGWMLLAIFAAVVIAVVVARFISIGR